MIICSRWSYAHHLPLKANVMETASGGGAKSDASIVNKELEENSQVMLHAISPTPTPNPTPNPNPNPNPTLTR